MHASFRRGDPAQRGFRLASWAECRRSPDRLAESLAAAGLAGFFPDGCGFAFGTSLPGVGFFAGAGAGVTSGLIVIGLPTFGFTTNGLGPGLAPATGLPSAVRLGPDPGGGRGVLPAGRAAA